MARGWESKAVEQQQELSAQPQVRKKKLTPEQVRSRQRREELMLSKAQVLQQLQTSQNPRHREMLQRALADLDQHLADEGVTPVP
jgi:hypothetical protein